MNIMKEIKFVPPTIETFNEGSPGVIKPEPVFIPASPATAAAPETDPHCQVHYYLMGDGHCTCSPAAPAETPRCQYKDCPAPTDRYDNVHMGYAWNWQGHPVPSTRNKHAWQPAASTEPERIQWMRLPPNSAHPHYDGLHMKNGWCASAGCTPACTTEKMAQPGEDARRANDPACKAAGEIFDKILAWSRDPRNDPRVVDIIRRSNESSIDSATRELKAELVQARKERDEESISWSIRYDSEVQFLQRQSSAYLLRAVQAESEVSRLTAELAALRVSHGKLERAVEHGEYLAKSAENYLDAKNKYDEDSELGNDLDPDALSDVFRAVRNDIYEFRKRVRASNQSTPAAAQEKDVNES